MASLKLWWPSTPEEFATHNPSPEHWACELASGWQGSDGSSASLDDIEGIRVGKTGRDYLPGLPANLHDFHYRVIRRLAARQMIDDRTRRAMRAAADLRHYTGLLAQVSVLIGWSGWKARRRAGARYQALRWFGDRHSRPTTAEAYRDYAPAA
jgi:hypothetical protein